MLHMQPIPLEYLRLGEFSESSESRKVSADNGRLLESLRFRSKPLCPFTVYHAAAKSMERGAGRYYRSPQGETGREHGQFRIFFCPHQSLMSRSRNLFSGSYPSL
jgi:hypothetical protein